MVLCRPRTTPAATTATIATVRTTTCLANSGTEGVCLAAAVEDEGEGEDDGVVEDAVAKAGGVGEDVGVSTTDVSFLPPLLRTCCKLNSLLPFNNISKSFNKKNNLRVSKLMCYHMIS